MLGTRVDRGRHLMAARSRGNFYPDEGEIVHTCGRRRPSVPAAPGHDEATAEVFSTDTGLARLLHRIARGPNRSNKRQRLAMALESVVWLVALVAYGFGAFGLIACSKATDRGKLLRESSYVVLVYLLLFFVLVPMNWMRYEERLNLMLSIIASGCAAIFYPRLIPVRILVAVAFLIAAFGVDSQLNGRYPERPDRYVSSGLSLRVF